MQCSPISTSFSAAIITPMFRNVPSPIRTRALPGAVIHTPGSSSAPGPDLQPPLAQRLQHVAVHRPAHERFAAHELPVYPRAVPRQRAALIPAPLLRPQAQPASPRARRRGCVHLALPASRCRDLRAAFARAGACRPARWRAAEGSICARNWPVCDAGSAATSSGVPAAITMPPSSPPSGPMSISRSAHLITSRLCSITTTLLPASTSRCEHLQQALHVGEVQPGGGLVEDVQRPARSPPSTAPSRASRAAPHRRRASSRAGPAARTRGRPRSASPGAGAPSGCARRSSTASSTGMSSTSAMLLPLKRDLERLAVVALAVALLARHVHVGQEVHLDLDLPVALAHLAAPALDVEAEPSGLVAARAGLLGLGEHVADHVEQARVGGRVGARRAPDRGLVDGDDLVQLLEPVDRAVRARTLTRAVQAVGRRPCTAPR